MFRVIKSAFDYYHTLYDNEVDLLIVLGLNERMEVMHMQGLSETRLRIISDEVKVASLENGASGNLLDEGSHGVEKLEEVIKTLPPDVVPLWLETMLERCL